MSRCSELFRFVAASAAIAVLASSGAATTVDMLCGAGDDPCVVDRAVVVEDLSVFDLGGRALTISRNGSLSVGSGRMTILAGDVRIEDGGSVTARGSGTATGGEVVVRGTSLEVAGSIDVSGTPGGILTLVVTGLFDQTGTMLANSLARDQSGGSIDIDAGTIRIAGNIRVDGGTEDSLGGDVEAIAEGDLTLLSMISAVGPDGGSVTLDAGSGVGSGNLTIADTASILADGIFQGGFGGGIDLTASGDGLTTGLIRIDGSMSVDGDTAGEEFGGGSGGCLSINATGDIIGENVAALLSVAGGGPDGDGGELEIVSDFGSVRLAVGLDVSAEGTEGGGGSIAIDATGPIEVGGTIVGDGGDGGEVTIISSAASVTILDTASIDVSGVDVGNGGPVCLESAAFPSGPPASVVVSGPVIADGGSSAGPGGAIEVIGLDSVRVTALMSADGGNGGGFGGSISLSASQGPAFVEATLRARGRSGSGGSVSVNGNLIEMPGSIDVSGSGASPGDTDVGLQATGPIRIRGSINATGGPGSGGLIEVRSDGAVSIAGTLTSDGGQMPGGVIDVRGCTVLLCGFNAEPENCGGATGSLRTTGPDGTNRVTGLMEAIIFGMMRTDLSGRNEVIVPPPGNMNATVLGDVQPAAIVVESDLTPCPGCGNGVTEAPETCDDGNILDGDGCSSMCQLEDAPPGDVNGDARVEEADRGFLATEIFDGDGDLVADVTGGTFRGTPRADSNEDALVNAADLVDLVRFIAGAN